MPGEFKRKEIVKWYEYFYQTKYYKGIDINTDKLSLKETVKLVLEKMGERE